MPSAFMTSSLELMVTQIFCFDEVKASHMLLLEINDSKIRDVKCLVVTIKN